MDSNIILKNLEQSLLFLEANLNNLNILDFQNLKKFLIKKVENYIQEVNEKFAQSNEDVLLKLGESEDLTPIMVTNIIVYDQIKKILETLNKLIDHIIDLEIEKLKNWITLHTGKKTFIFDRITFRVYEDSLEKVISLSRAQEVLNLTKDILELSKEELENIAKNSEDPFVQDLASALLDDNSLYDFIKEILTTQDLKVLTELMDSGKLESHKWGKPLSYILIMQVVLLKHIIKKEVTSDEQGEIPQ